MNLISSNPTSSIKWSQDSLITQKQQPLTWYKVRQMSKKILHPYSTLQRVSEKINLYTKLKGKFVISQTYFNAPEGDSPLAVDMKSMGKGEVWVNGESIGRYWTAFANGDCKGCHYAGTYRPLTCQLGCGQPTQRWLVKTDLKKIMT